MMHDGNSEDQKHLFYLTNKVTMTNTFLINKIDENQWDEFVHKHELGSIYHLSSWQQVIEKSFKHITCKHIVIQDHESTKILAGLPVFYVKSWLMGDRLVSAPFAMICDPLVTNPTDLSNINDYLLQLHKKVKTDYIEVRTTGHTILNEDSQFSASGGYQMHEVNVNKDPVHLFHSFHKKSVRVLIAKAEKAGLKIRHGEQNEDLTVFYKIFVQSRLRLGLPPIPFVFFKSLWQVFHPKGLLNLMLATYQGNVIGGLLLLEYKDSLIAEYACDLMEYRKFGVNQFLDWEAIKLAQSKGLCKYNFGRTSSSNHGLLQYKSRWATEAISLPAYYYPPEYSSNKKSEGSSIKYRVANKIFQYSPPNISILLGNFLYRHMG